LRSGRQPTLGAPINLVKASSTGDSTWKVVGERRGPGRNLLSRLVRDVKEGAKAKLYAGVFANGPSGGVINEFSIKAFGRPVGKHCPKRP